MSDEKRSREELRRLEPRVRDERERELSTHPDAPDEAVRFTVRLFPREGDSGEPLDVSDLPWAYELTFVPGPDTIQ
jgi:hypothetical protein